MEFGGLLTGTGADLAAGAAEDSEERVDGLIVPLFASGLEFMV